MRFATKRAIYNIRNAVFGMPWITMALMAWVAVVAFELGKAVAGS